MLGTPSTFSTTTTMMLLMPTWKGMDPSILSLRRKILNSNKLEIW